VELESHFEYGIDGWKGGDVLKSESDGITVLRCPFWAGPSDADARLIALAPEIAGAFRDLLDGVRWWEIVEHTGMSESRAKEIIALLAKLRSDR